MNIQQELRKAYNTIKSLQIEELTSENFGRAAYLAGMLDSAKLFFGLYNGEFSEERLEAELRRIKQEEVIN
jgi:hypothetical protein